MAAILEVNVIRFLWCSFFGLQKNGFWKLGTWLEARKSRAVKTGRDILRKSGLMEDQWLWQNEGAIGKISSEEVSTNGFGRMILLRKGVLEGRNSSMPSIFWVKNCLHGWIYHGWTGEGEKERKPSAGVSGVLTWGGKGNDRFGDLSRTDEICPENRKCWYVLPFGCGNLIRLVAIPETNSSTLKTGHPKRKFLFQPLVF